MNRFGERFTITTFGESHGKAIGCVLDGVPAGLAIDEALSKANWIVANRVKMSLPLPVKRRTKLKSSAVFSRGSAPEPRLLSSSTTPTKKAAITPMSKIFSVRDMPTLPIFINTVSATIAAADAQAHVKPPHVLREAPLPN